MASFSSQVLFSGLYLLSSQALFRASRRCLFLFPVFSLCGFFEDLCFLDSLLSVFRNSGGNGRNEPLQYIAGLHPVIEESIVFPINNLDRWILSLLRPDHALLQISCLIVSSHTSWRARSYPIPQGLSHIITLRAQSTLIFQRKRNPGITEGLYITQPQDFYLLRVSPPINNIHKTGVLNKTALGLPTTSTYLSLLPTSFTLSLHSTHSPHQSHLAYPPYFFGTFNNNSHWIYILKETYEIII